MQCSAPERDGPDIDAIKAGCQEAAEGFYQRHQSIVMTVCQGIPEAAEQTWLRVFDRILQGHAPRPDPAIQNWFDRWLSKVAKRVLIDLRRKERIADLVINTVIQQAAPTSPLNAKEQLLRDELVDQVFICIGAMDDSLADVLDLRFTQELSFKEVAEHLSAKEGETVSEPAAKQRCHRALALIRNYLLGKGLGHD